MLGLARARAWGALTLIALLVLTACGPAATATPPPAAAPTPAATTAAAPAATATRATSPVAAGAASPAARPASPAARPASPAASPRAGSPVAASPVALDQGPCTSANAERQPSGRQRLVIATGGTGGVFFPYGGGLARILSARLPNTEATAEVTGGSVDNMKLVGAGDADIGMSTADSALEAFQGQGVYRDTGKIPACTIANLYQSFIHVVALDGSGVNSIPDMKGKRVSVGSAGSSTEVAADRLLEAAGLNPRTDVQRDNLSVAESVAAMKDRKIAAFFWIGGLPTAAVTDLVATPNLRVKFIPTEQYLQEMRQRYGPVYTAFALPRATYAGLEADVPGIGVGNILFVNAEMSEQLVYDILKTIFDNLDEVKGVHPEARTLSLESAARGSSIPYHPGAIRFYTERGVWRGGQ